MFLSLLLSRLLWGSVFGSVVIALSIRISRGVGIAWDSYRLISKDSKLHVGIATSLELIPF